MILKLIFSADNNWGIGCDNKLLFNVKGDMAFFKKMTTGKVVIMGRKTLESLPGSKPLLNRENIVLTSDESYKVEGASVYHSIADMFNAIKGYDSDDLFVIGGAMLYKELLPYCDTAYITRFYAESKADTFMPDFDELTGWSLAEQSEEHEEDGIRYRFCRYEQEKPESFS